MRLSYLLGWSGYTVFVFVSTILFLLRQNIQPIKARLPIFVLFSSIGSYALASWVLLVPGLSDSLSEFPCAISRTVVNVGHVLFFLPYMFRSFRLYFIFNLNKEKLTEDDTFFRQKKRVKESFLLSVFAVCLLPSIIYCILESFLPLPSTIDCNSSGAPSQHIFWACLHFVEELILLVAIFLMRDIQDEFSINNELKIICGIWITYSVTTSILSFLDLMSMNLFAAFFVARSLFAHFCSCVWPLIRSYISPPLAIWSSTETVESLDRVLRDPVAFTFFQTFLFRNFAVEYILFWVEVELFKDIASYNSDMLNSRAQEITEKYLQDGCKLEVSLTKDVRESIILDLESSAVSVEMFDEAQEEVFKLMNNDFFPRFKQSSCCAELVAELRKQENIHGRLLLSNLL
eukprot:GILI01021988.1.p1 GENE.GILI01021988.1~~GILI01021988.1.p1  ORF type:complete len:403 (+),score=43.11 GILI01021988.1:54-1262(+)